MENSYKVLDACCSGRSFWYDKKDSRAVFMDKRIEKIVFDNPGHKEILNISPAVQADFTVMPFRDCTFDLVVFDPPHLRYHGDQSWLAKRYGRLTGDWEFELQSGFLECFRVLRPAGTLVFKWNDTDVPVSKILTLINERPLFGHKSGKNSKTHWICFIKTHRTFCYQENYEKKIG
jgi:SAM-dependent methyltransferase